MVATNQRSGVAVYVKAALGGRSGLDIHEMTAITQDISARFRISYAEAARYVRWQVRENKTRIDNHD